MSGDREGKKRCTAVILAGGSGSRMKSDVAKQFMLLEGKPLLWYSLQAVQQSKIIDDCILVAGRADAVEGPAEELDYVRREIVEKYGFTKVAAIVAGGSERCWSVENAMALIRDLKDQGGILDKTEYVFIHDSARPFLTEDILLRTYEAVQQHHACVAAMPSKDTVKLADEEGFAASTPDRSCVWIIQTPQVFDADLITEAYKKLSLLYRTPDSQVDLGQQTASSLSESKPPVTDDASVVEHFTDIKVKLVEGSYRNIKITTPEDMKIAEALLKQ
ncbi:MAG: 2-C-methyl-D-erythritol 4-phosphate cytidylyltransferase [Acetatifactor sp.]|nr:2-C-methyl-D-erythritol 4-phosphate cytidylyltransferase [Acetatifactor sp.]